jgi:ABC-type transport system substrate-binding protein
VESGAFVIDTWQKGSMMSLVPNPHASQPAKLERIILQVVPDASTRRIILERGDVDFAVQLATSVSTCWRTCFTVWSIRRCVPPWSKHV